jgi:uncharacterized repeat protein (TIGR01451 family)
MAFLGTRVTLLAVCLATASGAGVASATSAPTPVGPQLSIAIGDGHTTAAAGNRLTYTITVENLGSTDITGLVVTQSMPAGLELESADSSGGALAGNVTWDVNLKATAKAVLHSTMGVYDTPPDLLRLARVAGASTADARRPIVCATHSDQLPAGAARTTTGSAATAAHAGWWYLVGGFALLAVATLMALLQRRRRTRQPG